MRTATYWAGAAWVIRDLADTYCTTRTSPRILWLCLRCRLTPEGRARTHHGWQHASSY